MYFTFIMQKNKILILINDTCVSVIHGQSPLQADHRPIFLLFSAHAFSLTVWLDTVRLICLICQAASITDASRGIKREVHWRIRGCWRCNTMKPGQIQAWQHSESPWLLKAQTSDQPGTLCSMWEHTLSIRTSLIHSPNLFISCQSTLTLFSVA